MDMSKGELAEGKQGCCQRLGVCALGIALGVSWAIGVLILALLSWRFGFGGDAMHMFSSVYKGLDASPIGVVFGVLWAFLDGFIAGVIIAAVYNWVNKRHHCKVCCGTSHEAK